MRCFFHLIGHSRMVIDDEGTFVDDLEHAQREATTTIEALLEDSIHSGADWRGWRLEICDQFGRKHAELCFDQFRVPNRLDANGG